MAPIIISKIVANKYEMRRLAISNSKRKFEDNSKMLFLSKNKIRHMTPPETKHLQQLLKKGLKETSRLQNIANKKTINKCDRIIAVAVPTAWKK